MIPLCKLLSKCISNDFLLKKSLDEWKIRNTGPGDDVILEVNKDSSIAFTLDGERPFRFFSLRPLPNITKMCDGIVVCSHDNKDYIFIVELKSSRLGHYEKQMINGKHFCEWMVTLLREHGYYDKEVVYVGILFYNIRPKADKNRRDRPHKKCVGGFDVYHCENQETFYLLDLIKS